MSLPSQARLLTSRLRQQLAQGHVYLAGQLGPACWSSDDSPWSDREPAGHQSLVAAGGLVKENLVGLRGEAPTPFRSGCAFLGDGLCYCVCGINTRVGLFFFFYGSTINRTFPALVCHLEKVFISSFGPDSYKRQTPFQLQLGLNLNIHHSARHKCRKNEIESP